ncbi:MAG: hypothetical protein QM493_00775 [Sulfurovum sp.]
MSNGGIETFRVIDPCFTEGIRNFPSSYNMKVEKLGIEEADKAIQSITYNMHGSNARINNNSIDNSTNIVNINQDVVEYLTQLRQEIEKLVTSNKEKKEALEIVTAIEREFESNSPNKTIINALIGALPILGNIATITSLILSIVN